MRKANTEECVHQTEILRRLTSGQKWRVAEALYWQARAWKKAALKMQHPDWSDEQIGRAVKEQFAHGTTA